MSTTPVTSQIASSRLSAADKLFRPPGDRHHPKGTFTSKGARIQAELAFDHLTDDLGPELLIGRS
jgi:hypothetical protein